MNFPLTDFSYKDVFWPVRGTCSEKNESVTTLVSHSPFDTSPYSRIKSAKDAGL